MTPPVLDALDRISATLADCAGFGLTLILVVGCFMAPGWVAWRVRAVAEFAGGLLSRRHAR
jgi:hypothetical protein